MYYARYQTATPLIIGPVIRATNGYSPLTGLTSASIGFYYWVGTGPTTGNYATAGSSSVTEVASGYYKTWISSDMTNALGPGIICYETSGSSGLPMVDHYIVLSQHTYDALIKGTGTDLLQVDMQQIVGATAGLTVGGIAQTVAKYIGSTGTSMTSGTMATSVNAFYVIDKYVGSSNTTFSSGTLSTSNSVFKVMVKNWGSSGTTVASGQMTTSLHAFNVVTLAVAASGTTVNSTFPWHQTSAQGFLADVRYHNQATFSTRSGDNIEAVYYNAGATVDKTFSDLGGDDVNVVQIGGTSNYLTTAGLIQTVAAFIGSSGASMASGIMTTSRHAFNVVTLAVAASGTTVNSTFPWHQTSAQGFLIDTGQLVGLSTLATANLSDLSTFDVAEVVTISTGQLVGLSTLATANFNNMSTFGVSNVYDVLTHEELMKVMQTRMLGDSTFDGTNLKYYDHAGTSFIGFAITTDATVRTT